MADKHGRQLRRQPPGAFIRFTAPRRNGLKMPVTSLPAWSAAVPGSAFRATSAPRIVAGMNPASGTTFSTSEWRVYSLLPERSYSLVAGHAPTPPVFSALPVVSIAAAPLALRVAAPPDCGSSPPRKTMRRTTGSMPATRLPGSSRRGRNRGRSSNHASRHSRTDGRPRPAHENEGAADLMSAAAASALSAH
jgi:hypothetical protein